MPYKDKNKQREAVKKHREVHRNDTEWLAKQAERQKKWRQENPDRERDIQKKSHQTNQWGKKNPDKVRIIQERYRLTHLEKMAEKSRKFRQNNPEKIKLYADKQKSNQEYQGRHRQLAREWARTHPEENRERLEEWKENNPDKWAISNRRHTSKRRREMGFNPLNNYFDNSEAHHIDNNNVIFIPEELHKSHPHNHNKPETMIKINILSFDYMSSACL